MTVRVYTAAENCEPCHEIDRLIKEGRVSEDVQLIDIETDEGFELFKTEVLDHGDGAVPSAYKDGQVCKIHLVDGAIEFECPSELAPPEPEP